MKKWQIIIVVLIVIAVILGGSYAGIRNNMVRKKEQVNSAWSQVDVVIQRRADLIPNLVATVKGYAAHEEAVFGAVTRAREDLLAARTPADRIRANGQLDAALGRLLAVVENYPQLKANENFLELQNELEGTETASPSSDGAITRRCRTIILTSVCSPTTLWPAFRALRATMTISKHPPALSNPRRWNSRAHLP